MKRILLFLATNIAVILVLSIVLRILGVDRILDAQGAGINMTNLLIFAAVFGFGGSFISLAMSKWTAKRLMGAQVIDNPRTAAEMWLVDTVKKQAAMAGIGMPEVAVFESDTPNAFATGMNKNNALVAVSTGLLRVMNKQEVEAVLGHEMSHVANGDMITLSLIQGVVNTFVIFLSRSWAISSTVSFSKRGGARSGVLCHHDRRSDRVRHPGEHHRHVVQPTAGIPCRCRRGQTGRP
jgi:heat shock protein HtpX